jgi:predicted O-methyltransferase YrrM
MFQWVLEQCGFVVARANDYYSPLPSRRQLKSSMERWSKPSSMRGIDYDLAGMKCSLAGLIREYHNEFEALVPYEAACQMGFGPGYTRLDAIVLYAMIRARKPAQYLEVGSGLSTYYANAAARMNAREGHPMQMTCIEPYPFAALFQIPGISVRKMQVQDENLDVFATLGENDVLFIDSSHIVRLDGDVPFLLLEVLPALRAGVLIHVHDIPFPYHGPYPADYWIYEKTWPVWWNESMLLHALLCGNKQFSISLSTPLIRYHDEPFLARMIPGYTTIKEEPNTFSSIWLEKAS